MSEQEMKVRNESASNKYVISVAGEDAGEAFYQVRDDVVVFTHTEVDDRWEGRGVGSTLVRGALDDVVSSHRRFTPRCPFVAAYVERHPEYAASRADG